MRLFIGVWFSPVWKIIQPFSYIAALLIWTVALWSYEPARSGFAARNLTDVDYQGLTGRTRQALGSIQEQLNRTPDR